MNSFLENISANLIYDILKWSILAAIPFIIQLYKKKVKKTLAGRIRSIFQFEGYIKKTINYHIIPQYISISF